MLLNTLKVRKSKIHGNGVFTLEAIAKGSVLGEYTGKRYKSVEHIPSGWSSHLFYFWLLSNGEVIDASINGNDLRFINHSCNPSVTSREVRIKNGTKSHLTVIYYVCRDVNKGEELTINYNIRAGDTDRDVYKCLCKSLDCTGTMLNSNAYA